MGGKYNFRSFGVECILGGGKENDYFVKGKLIF